jgi:hypothetical protein
MFPSSYFKWDDFLIVRRHWIIMAFRFFKFFFFLIISVLLYYVAVKFHNVSEFAKEVTQYIIFPIIFFILNYAFIKLILYHISYYNKLIIIQWHRIILIESKLIESDYVEIININKITKIDRYINWIFKNILNIWTIVIEQQRETIRELHFIPTPHKIVNMVNDKMKWITV